MTISKAVRCWIVGWTAVCIWLVASWPGKSVAAIEEARPPAAITLIDENGAEVPPNAVTPNAQTVDVQVAPNGQLRFSPVQVNIAVGDTVRWIWNGNGHTVTSGSNCSANSQFCSPNNTNCGAGSANSSGFIYQHTFTTAGTFSYFCAIHCGQMNGAVVVSPTCTPPPSGMRGWWPGDGSGRDIEGGNGGAVEGNVTFVAGRVGQAFRLGGAGDRVLVGTAPSLQLQDFTIDAWVKRSSATVVTNNPDAINPGGAFFAYGNQGYGFAIDQPTSRLLLTQIGVSGVFSTQTITDTNFHHVAVTKQGGTVTFYVDGVAGAPVAYNPTFTFATPAAIGARGDTNLQNSFFGDIDELEIFGRALTGQEILNLFSAGAAGKCKAPQPIAAVSRKTHGGTGAPLDVDLVPNSTRGIECRTGGTSGVHQMVVQFPSPVSVTSANVVSGTGSVVNFTVSGGFVTLNLSGVANVQNLLIRLGAVGDGTLFGDVPIAMGVLVGDTTGNGSVTASDVAQVKSVSGQAVTSANFRADVNVSGGAISASDIGLVKSTTGSALP